MTIEGITLNESKIPTHVAIIMDGNGRWASLKGKQKRDGHRAGSEKVLEIVEIASKCGVKTLSLYAFSTENWSRPKEEISFLMRLLEEFFKKEVSRLIKEGIRIKHIGRKDNLPKNTLKIVEDAEEKSKSNERFLINVALNYGSRDEIVRAVRHIAEDIARGIISSEEITEEFISSRLDTAESNDPDLLIRTSGEYRISNFLLYQIAYSEIWITQTLWPDFSKKDFVRAIADYQKRDRRFGARP